MKSHLMSYDAPKTQPRPSPTTAAVTATDLTWRAPQKETPSHVAWIAEDLSSKIDALETKLSRIWNGIRGTHIVDEQQVDGIMFKALLQECHFLERCVNILVRKIEASTGITVRRRTDLFVWCDSMEEVNRYSMFVASGT